jgi:hypothetical protein
MHLASVQSTTVPRHVTDLTLARRFHNIESSDILREMEPKVSGDSYEQTLVQEVLAGGPGADRAALALFERREPASPSQAVNLVVPYGPVPPDTFACIRRAYDIYRHTSAASRD